MRSISFPFACGVCSGGGIDWSSRSGSPSSPPSRATHDGMARHSIQIVSHLGPESHVRNRERLRRFWKSVQEESRSPCPANRQPVILPSAVGTVAAVPDEVDRDPPGAHVRGSASPKSRRGSGEWGGLQTLVSRSGAPMASSSQDEVRCPRQDSSCDLSLGRRVLQPSANARHLARDRRQPRQSIASRSPGALAASICPHQARNRCQKTVITESWVFSVSCRSEALSNVYDQRSGPALPFRRTATFEKGLARQTQVGEVCTRGRATVIARVALPAIGDCKNWHSVEAQHVATDS